MRVFSDFHHEDLYHSLQLLFERRLGAKLYRPIGMEWYPEYWAIYPHIDTAKQYLQINNEPSDGSLPLNDPILGVWLNDSHNGYPHRGITLDKFKKTKFDILICSIPQHIPIFKKLISQFQPQAKLIYQIGNQWDVDPNEVKNVMASAKVDFPPGINGIIYHQEFDLDIFHYEPVDNKKKIYSFINCLGTADLFKKDWELFLALEKLMPDWEFKSFGGQCRDGAIGTTSELALRMRQATFIFHCKSGGDGYGHIIHNAAAVGRPLITNRTYYHDKLGDSLLDERTCIDINGKSPEHIAREIIAISDASDVMGYNIYCRFKSIVDFNAEAQQIKQFLQKLQ